MPSGMTLVNMALILLPFLCNGMAVSLVPDRKREYMLRLSPHLPHLAPRTSHLPPLTSHLVLPRTSHLSPPTSYLTPSPSYPLAPRTCPGRYMLCLALFHAFFGYTTLAVPLLMLVPLQLPVSIGFVLAEYATFTFGPTLTLT
jgi:hypothetical protein